MPLGKYSAICVILWGVVLSCFAAVDNFGGAVAIRLLLGICEASVTPGFALLTSQVDRFSHEMLLLITNRRVTSGTREKNKVNEQAYGSASTASAKSSAAQSPTASQRVQTRTDRPLRRGRLSFWLRACSRSALAWSFSGSYQTTS